MHTGQDSTGEALEQDGKFKDVNPCFSSGAPLAWLQFSLYSVQYEMMTRSKSLCIYVSMHCKAEQTVAVAAAASRMLYKV